MKYYLNISYFYKKIVMVLAQAREPGVLGGFCHFQALLKVKTFLLANASLKIFFFSFSEFRLFLDFC